MAAATTSLREYQIPVKMKGEDLFKRQRRADSGAYASEKQKHQMLKDFVNLITTQAATFTSSDSYLFFAQFCIFLYMFSPLKSFISCNLSRFLMQILYLLLVFVFLSLCSYGSQVLSNIRAAVPSTVHKNPKTFASSRETRTGHAQKDEKHGTRLKCNHGVVIEKRPNDNGKLKEAAVTKMSSSGKQLSNKPLALHDTPNHMALVDYVADIYDFYKDYERFDRPLDYIQHQMGITEDMRATVVDWIIAVHNKFALRLEALYLAIYIIDRYLSLERLHGRELKLVGISALYISSKYDDMRAPQVLDFIDITDGAYSREEVLAMEKIILKSLHWKLTIPTQYMFIVQFLQTSKCDKAMERMVFFLAELGLMQYSTVKFSPSVAAASAVYAARWTLRKSPHWTETLKHHTGLSEIQLMDCAQILVKSLFDAPRSNLKVVYNKYSIEQF